MGCRLSLSLGTRFFLIVLMAVSSLFVFMVCGKAGVYYSSVAVGAVLILSWWCCRRLILRPVSVLVEAAQKTANDSTPLRRVESALQVSELAPLVAAINAMVSAVQDRSGRRRVVEKGFRHLVESLPEALFVQHANNIVLANPAALNLLGATSKEQIADRSIMEMVHPDCHEAFTQQVAQARKGKPPSVSEGKLVRLDGTEVEVEVVVARVEYQSQPAVQFIARDITLRKQAEQQLRELSVRLMTAEDEERRRIALDLHDSTAQELAAMIVNLGIIEKAVAECDEDIRKCFAECRKLAGHCSKQVRGTAYLLYPALLDELGLVAALKNHQEVFAKRTGIKVVLDVPPDLGRLVPEVELALFRVVQESLGNIYRHSGSHTAVIKLLRDAESIVLEVQDQGHGIPFALKDGAPVSTERLGLGIAGMRERLRHFGGQLKIISDAHGTVVRASLPLQKRRL